MSAPTQSWISPHRYPAAHQSFFKPSQNMIVNNTQITSTISQRYQPLSPDDYRHRLTPLHTDAPTLVSDGSQIDRFVPPFDLGNKRITFVGWRVPVREFHIEVGVRVAKYSLRDIRQKRPHSTHSHNRVLIQVRRDFSTQIEFFFALDGTTKAFLVINKNSMTGLMVRDIERSRA